MALLTCSIACQSQEKRIQTLGLGQSISNLEDQVPVIFQDSKLNYWFCGGNGVYCYDGIQLKRYTTNDGLNSNGVYSIQEDSSGLLYFDTNKGISIFDGSKFSSLPLVEDRRSKEHWDLASDDVWFKGSWEENGPYRYDGKELVHLKFPDHPQSPILLPDNPNPSFSIYGIYSIYRDSDDSIWFGTSNLGACRYDGNDWFWISDEGITELDAGPAPGVRAIVQDAQGDFWFSNNISSKYRITEDKGFLKLPGLDLSKYSGVPNFFMSILIDNLDRMWMLSYDEGVWCYDNGVLHHYEIEVAGKNAFLFSLYQDKKGQIWVGSHNAGALKFEKDKFIRFNLEK